MAILEYHGVEEDPAMPGADMRRFNLIGHFRDMASANRAVGDLKQRGFGEQDVTVLGTTASVVNSDTGVSKAEGKVVRSIFNKSMAGMAAGVVVGAIVGIIALAALLGVGAFDSGVSAGGFIVAAIIGAIFGLILGALVGGIVGLDPKQAGVATYSSVSAEGEALIGVHATDERQVSMASDALRAAGAVSLEKSQPVP
ncbi:MAG TPA: hypothetical protein VIO16_02455 [Dehalococcoidia bacterium]